MKDQIHIRNAEAAQLARTTVRPARRFRRGARGSTGSASPGRPPALGSARSRRPAIERVVGRLDPEALIGLVERKPLLFRPLALRLMPPRAPPPEVDLPPLRTAADVRDMLSATLAAVARGEISPAEALRLARRARRRLPAIRKARRLLEGRPPHKSDARGAPIG